MPPWSWRQDGSRALGRRHKDTSRTTFRAPDLSQRGKPTEVSRLRQTDDGRVFNQFAVWAPDPAQRKLIAGRESGKALWILSWKPEGG
jgi:hypothetical protein